MAATDTSSTSPAIETAGLTKRFGDRAALAEADLLVPRGVAFGFLGPNGAGKTTLIRTLLGLTHASAGEMHLLGLPVPARRAEALARVGAIVEEPRFHRHLTGRENLRIAAACRTPDADARIPGALERVGMTERADERVKSYSMGMRQRLGIARCLLADPELLILDEPTNGLDPAGITEFRAFVRDMVDEGRTVFLSSHLLDEVEKICDMVAIVDRGRILMQGTVAEMASGGRPTMTIGCDDVAAAARMLRDHPAVVETVPEDGDLRVVLADTADAAVADINRRLVEAGIAVHRLEPARVSLEERFLEVTSRLGAPA
ncbi:MAG TPA: ABC transporter ATP-binding protein [Gaiellales bacterium]|jgi:ABC-2 type transport system ATP-binding protein